MWDSAKDSKMSRLAVRLAAARRGDADQAVRRVRRLRRRLGDRRRAVHAGAGIAVRLVARPHARRPHQSLGAHLAALRPGRLQAAQPRRPRRRLADRLRRHQAVLRQARSPRRHLRQRCEGIAQRAGRHLPAAAEAALLRAADQAGGRQAEDHVHPVALSILTQPLNGRPACHYCGQCGRGCATHANFSSTSVLLPPALATGKLTLITNAMAREVLTDDERPGDRRLVRRHAATGATTRCARASSCSPRARASRRACCSTRSRRASRTASPTRAAWSASTSPTRPASRVGGFIPKMEHGVPHNEDGVGGMHLYMPWWLDNAEARLPARLPHRARRRQHRRRASGSWAASSASTAVGGYGKSLKDDYRRYYGATIGFAGRGEMIPNEDSYCEIDPNVVDHWGIPVLRFHWKWSEHELNQAKHMQETFRALIHEMGGTPLSPMPTREQRLRPRRRSAASSTRWARRGWAAIRTTSVLNAQLPGARREEPVRRRRRAVRVAGRQELHVDDPGARRGARRSSSRSSATRDAMKLQSAECGLQIGDRA